MAVDLGTAYISLVPTTKDFDKGIKAALDGTVKHAEKTANSMGGKLSTGITTHLGKAGEKSGDAFGKSFSPRVQSAGKSAMQGLANLMLGSAQGIGGEVGGTISSSLAGALTKGSASAIDALDAIGTKGGAAMSSKLQTAGMVAAGGVALVGTAAIAATAELYKIGQAWDEIADGITAKTGAIGDRLDAITQSVKNVAVETAAAPGDIAAVTAQLVQTLKLSGTDLEMLTKQIADYNAMNSDSPLNIRDFAKAMKQFGITSASDMSDQLDRLNNIAQNTGIPLNNLVGSLKMAAPVAKEFKMPLETVTQLLATFEDAGLDATSAAGALRIALGNIAANGTGEAPAVQLQNIITRIRELYAAGDETGALDLAKSTFGKSFTQILPLIKDNTLEIGNLDTAVANLGPTIEEQRQATSDFAEEWRKFRNFLEVELEPVATRVFGGIQNFLSYTIGTIAGNIRDIRSALDGLYEGGNISTGGPLTPGIPAAPGILGGAAGINPGIGINGGGPGGNAASQILGGAAGAVPGSGVLGTAGRGYFNSKRASAYLDQVTGGGALQSGNWGQLDSLASSKFGLNMTSGYRSPNGPTISGVPAAKSFHSTGQAHDFSGTPEQMLAFANYMVDNYGSQLKELIFDHPAFTRTINNGAIKGPFGSFYTMDQAGPHGDHVHVAFDQGGYLQPGTTMAFNGTGKPELILTAEQQQALAAQGVDPNTLLHGTGNGAAPGPAPNADTTQQQPDYGMDFVRSLGFIPATAGSNTKAGTSSLSKFIDMGSSVVGGLIDTGVNLGNMAISAAIAAGAAGGSFGSAAAAAPAAQMAASYGLQLLGNQGKTIANYWFGLAGIGADALLEQLSPFGAPRWLGYDYAAFMPQLGIQQAALSTVEKMGGDAITKYFAQQGQVPGGQPPMPSPGGPVTPSTMPGAVEPPAPGPESPTNLDPSGPAPDLPPVPSPLNLLPNLMGYDQGGMLPPGGMGINMTNRPEPVLTPQQWEAIAASSSEPSRSGPLVQNLYATDMQEAIRKLEQTKRRDMMQYAGRP